MLEEQVLPVAARRARRRRRVPQPHVPDLRHQRVGARRAGRRRRRSGRRARSPSAPPFRRSPCASPCTARPARSTRRLDAAGRARCASASAPTATARATRPWRRWSASCSPQRGATIAVAESCTGGLIGHRLTNVPGSSAYVLGGIVAYTNAVKESLLGVRAETLRAARRGERARRPTRWRAACARLLGADHRPRDHRHRRPRRRHAGQAGRHGVLRPRRRRRHRSRRYQLWGNRDWVKLLTSQVALDWVRRVHARRGSDRVGDPASD